MVFFSVACLPTWITVPGFMGFTLSIPCSGVLLGSYETPAFIFTAVFSTIQITPELGWPIRVGRGTKVKYIKLEFKLWTFVTIYSSTIRYTCRYRHIFTTLAPIDSVLVHRRSRYIARQIYGDQYYLVTIIGK